MKQTIMGYVIVTKNGRKERVLPEGPWDTQEAAQTFCDAEVHEGSVARLLFTQEDYCYLESDKGNQFVSPNGETFTARRVRMLEGWSF